MTEMREGSWLQTFTGRQFWPLDPRANEVSLEDIAHALALMNRFAGHTRVPYCPTLDQRVLTTDLRWIPAGDVRVGDTLLGFDEAPVEIGTAGKKRRRFRHAVVRAAEPFRLPTIRLVMADGSSVRSSTTHPWLIATKVSRNQVWATAQEVSDALTAGRRRYLHRFMRTWETAESWDAGWLAGIFDGEGHVCVSGRGTRHLSAGVAQNPGLVLDKIHRTMLDLGFNSATECKSQQTKTMNLQLRGGWREVLHLLGRLRPIRLLSKFGQAIQSGQFNYQMDGMGFPTEIVRAIPEGDDWCMGIETSTHTYLCEGFAAHNSVGEHSLRVSNEVYSRTKDPVLALCGLLHDGSEAYCVDVPTPLKPYLNGYKEIEAKVMEAIRGRFNLPPEFWHHPEVKRADRVLLLTEARDLMGRPPSAWDEGDPDVRAQSDVLVPFDWTMVESWFVHQANYLLSAIGGTITVPDTNTGRVV